MRFQAFQGDVSIEKVASIPSSKPVLRDKGRIVLAYGEVTGHAHAIADPQAELLEPAVRSAEEAILNVRFLKVMASSGVDLTHEEHSTIHLDPGIYKVTQQRQYSPQAIQRVAD